MVYVLADFPKKKHVHPQFWGSLKPSLGWREKSQCWARWLPRSAARSIQTDAAGGIQPDPPAPSAGMGRPPSFHFLQRRSRWELCCSFQLLWTENNPPRGWNHLVGGDWPWGGGSNRPEAFSSQQLFCRSRVFFEEPKFGEVRE